MVWPTARVRLTARSKSISPLRTTAEQRRERLGVGVGERRLQPVLGEAERAPEPARLLEVTPVSVGDLAAR